MSDSVKNKIKLIVTVVIVGLLVWFLIINPMLIFHSNENKLESAAKRYFALNSSQLPTGERVKTVGLDMLYHKSYVEGDLYVPYTDKVCSIKNSWVKVKNVNNEYKYYVYLECGILRSSIDHRGPEIKINGDTKMEVALGNKYQELGVKSVVDDSDGKMNARSVVITSNVDTSKIGTYEVKYSAVDSLGNRNEVIREVEVVERLYSTMKNKLKNSSIFVGEPEDNYIRLSNMLFRVYGVDSNNNVIIVADSDIGNVNFSKLDDWLDYYYEKLNKTTKELIVKTKYCNMVVDEKSRDTTKCNAYTEAKNVYIPSIIQVNKAQAGEENFMKPNTMSWVSNMKNNKEAYVTRNFFFEELAGQSFIPYSINDNYGVRPMMTIKGSTMIVDGDGTRRNPYVFGDTPKAKNGDKLNTRYTGEYVSISGEEYRIVEVMKDGTTKVISNDSLKTYDGILQCSSTVGFNNTVYNPNNKKSAAYFINNQAVQYVDTSYFVNHEIEVPIYKNKIIYKSEIKTKKYKVKLSAPNLFEIFSAQTVDDYFGRSFWCLNTSQQEGVQCAVFDLGVPINEEASPYKEFGVRIVAYVKTDAEIANGKGTFEKPYRIN